MIGVHEQQHALACMEVWGGNRSVTRTVELPALTAWVYSRPAGEQDRGGDVHYLSVCGQAVLSRVVLADVSGHGSEVSAPAQVLHALMREHINTWDQTDFVRGLNQSFRGCVAHGKYATAAILGVLRSTGETAFTNAGHLPPLWYRSKIGSWDWLDEEACEGACGLDGLPVGLIRGTKYRQTLIQLDPADIIVLYTDGITEADDASGAWESVFLTRTCFWMLSNVMPKTCRAFTTSDETLFRTGRISMRIWTMNCRSKRSGIYSSTLFPVRIAPGFLRAGAG